MYYRAFSLPSYHFQITLFPYTQETFKIITYDYRGKGYLGLLFSYWEEGEWSWWMGRMVEASMEQTELWWRMKGVHY